MSAVSLEGTTPPELYGLDAECEGCTDTTTTEVRGRVPFGLAAEIQRQEAEARSRKRLCSPPEVANMNKRYGYGSGRT